MKNRRVAVAAAALVAGLAGCSSPPAALGSTTAKVTIDGKDIGGSHAVRCSQAGWSWIIETVDSGKGFTAVLATGANVSAQTVEFRDVGGFTGSYWAGNIGEAEVRGAGGEYTITGSADGYFANNPSNAATATFRIEVDC